MLTEARLSRSNKLPKLDLQRRKERGYNDGVTEKMKEIRKKKKKKGEIEKGSSVAPLEKKTELMRM